MLHHALGAAGRPSPLGADRVAALLDGPSGTRSVAAASRGGGLSLAGAVALARSVLRRYR